MPIGLMAARACGRTDGNHSPASPRRHAHHQAAPRRGRRYWQSSRVLPIVFTLPQGATVELDSEDARTLARQLWQMGVGGANRSGMALSVAITDAFVGDFSVEVEAQDLEALRTALGRLASALRLSPGLGAFRAAIPD
jgi:hypothetical protein